MLVSIITGLAVLAIGWVLGAMAMREYLLDKFDLKRR